MAIVIIESLYENCNNINDLWHKYKKILDNNDIISVNQKCQIISQKQIYQFYKKYLNSYQPILNAGCLKGKTLIIAIGSEDTIKNYLPIDSDIIYISQTLTNKVFSDIDLSNSNIRTISSIENADITKKIVIKIKNKKFSIQQKLEKELFSEACKDFKNVADWYYALGLLSTARTYYGYSAIAAEKTEKWREISYLWYCAYKPIKSEKSYQDYNSLEHTFPSISFEKWATLSDAEKKGRALQYSAYSDDNHDGPSDSYWIYEKAALKYLEADNYERAIECAVSATNRYAIYFHQVDEKLMSLWKKLINDARASQYYKLLYISFHDIYRNLNLYKSEEADFFYIEARKIQEKMLKEKKHYSRFFLSKIWSISTKYGTNISRIVIVTIFLVFLVFPLIYFCCQYYKMEQTPLLSFESLYQFINCIEMSMDVFLNIGDVPITCRVSHFTVIIESFYAYITLVIISSSIISKLLSQKL